jgi:hypothetical protein
MSRLSRARDALRRLWHGETANEPFAKQMLAKELGDGD